MEVGLLIRFEVMVRKARATTWETRGSYGDGSHRHVPATLLTDWRGVAVVARASKFLHPFPNTMTLNLKNESISIFQDGKLKPGIYKIQNIVGQTYVDIQEHTRELCGRPATALEGKGLVGFCPRLARIFVILIIFSGKFCLPGPDIPYVEYSVETHFASIAVY